MYRLVRIRVSITFPWEIKPVDVGIDIPAFEAKDGPLQVLPRDRELPWCVESQEIARRITADRPKFAKQIASVLTDKIMEIIQSRDPIDGYDPGELP